MRAAVALAAALAVLTLLLPSAAQAKNCGRKALGEGSGTQSKTTPTARCVKGKRVARAEFGL